MNPIEGPAQYAAQMLNLVQTDPGQHLPAEEQGPVTATTPTDSFATGRQWKNRSQSAGQVSCRCGNCPACAAKAYVDQAEKLAPEANTASDSTVAGRSSQSIERHGRSQKSDPQQKEQASGNARLRDMTGEPLSRVEMLELAQLKSIDLKVRAHERAHLAAAGSLAASGANFQYAVGPDGQKYAVAGEVSIDTSKESDPQETITKMRTVRAAALAPTAPSAQDRKVAARASIQITEASRELSAIRFEDKKAQEGKTILQEAGMDQLGRQEESDTKQGIEVITV